MESNEIEFIVKDLEKRIDKLEIKVQELDTTMHEFDKTQSLIVQKLDALIDSVDEIKHHQMEMAEKPANNWDKAKWIIISAVLTAVVTGIIAYIT